MYYFDNILIVRINFTDSQTNYYCQFENSVECGIQQETLDNGEWIIVNQTYTRSNVLYGESFPDHSTGTDTGMSIGDNCQYQVNGQLYFLTKCFPDHNRHITKYKSVIRNESSKIRQMSYQK